MPFKSISKLGKTKKKQTEELGKKPEPRDLRDVLSQVPGLQTRKNVKEIVFEVIKSRRSVRDFQSKSISDGILMKILDAARYAPSAGNQQPWEFIIVKDPERKQRLQAACFNQECVLTAPVLIVVAVNMKLATSKYKERGEKLYGIQGVSAAMQNILLAAEALGIGSAWVGAFSEKAVAVLTQCPDYIRPAAIIALGYPAEEPPMPPRQPLTEFVHYEVFGETYLTKELYKDHEVF